MSPLDLEAIRARACALRNTAPGHEEDGETPEVAYLYECEETGYSYSATVHHCPPPEGYSYAGCMLVVGAGCELLTVATHEGEQMPEVAEAICHAGADILAMADEIERWRGERYRLAETAWDDAKDMFAPNSDAEFRLTQMAEELEATTPNPIVDLLLDYIADDLSHGKRPMSWWFELSDEDQARFHEDAQGAVRQFLKREALGRKVCAMASKEVQP